MRLPSAKALIFVVIALAGALLLWWLLSLDKVENRTRNEEVEMIDIAVPPPPPPPVEPEQVQDKPQETPAEAPQTVQPDPLTPPAAPSANPPAGSLDSLLQDPTGAAGAFIGGPRGQGGTGKGPLIGGIGKGAPSQASRAYADRVRLHVQRALQRNAGLRGKSFRFRVRVNVSPGGAVSMGRATGIDPAELAGAIAAALSSVGSMDAPPPEGMPNFINIDINQS